MDNLPLAYPATGCRALFRQQPEHFQVTETLNFQPSGSGDHLYLYLQKRETNTDWLARELARKANLKPVDVGYAGRKDRFAVTRQWFSLHLPESKAVDQSLFQGRDYQLIEQTRHTKKLRKGEIDNNHFIIQLTEFEGDFQHFRQRCELLSAQGFPNYFGPQRFGNQGANIDKAKAMLSGQARVRDRNKRSIYLSAARSYLFNLVLANRIQSHCWNQPVNGDLFWDEQQQSLTGPLEVNQEILEKVNSGQYRITAPMPGDGISDATGDSLALESAVYDTEKTLCKGIADSRIQWQRRPVNVIPANISCRENSQGVEVEFSLPTGVFATSLLRELIDIKNQN